MNEWMQNVESVKSPIRSYLESCIRYRHKNINFLRPFLRKIWTEKEGGLVTLLWAAFEIVACYDVQRYASLSLTALIHSMRSKEPGHLT